MLTEKEKITRINVEIEMLKVFENTRYPYNIWTGESWISYDNPHKYVWISSDDEIPVSERTKISTKKIMIIVFWSTSGMKNITLLPQGKTITKKMFIRIVLGDIKKKLNKTRPKFFGN